MQRLDEEVASFEAFYDTLLGRRVAELDQLEAEIATAVGAESGAGGTGTVGDDERIDRPEASWQSTPGDIKSLYREVAKTIHPDLAGDAAPSPERHELMSKANRAYAAHDLGTLQEILQNWWRPGGGGEVAWAELVHLRELILRERQSMFAVEAKIAELRGGLALRLKHRLDAGTIGSGLLADMITAADLTIDRARQRLAALQRDRQPQSAGRTVDFSDRFTDGTVYLRDRRSANYGDWARVGAAKGIFEIGLDQSVRLDLKAEPGSRVRGQESLRPDDLVALFLYGVCDADLGGITHLNGLEELYLAGARLTDDALDSVSPLCNLKRIYIYQTGISDRGLARLKGLPKLAGLTSSGNCITDEGLAGFRRTRPGVKTVSFHWNR